MKDSSAALKRSAFLLYNIDSRFSVLCVVIGFHSLALCRL